ncbi:hypothetical protein TIFTF001_020355 [Ficus carica]|uniref:Uncharacterized protein n=1 Tax=Ficus carica TaxID=3494 RepID=A0AA88AES5_FICCA|nr:hypothetical protein TIFTF001_020355 [Ficus carica]
MGRRFRGRTHPWRRKAEAVREPKLQSVSPEEEKGDGQSAVRAAVGDWKRWRRREETHGLGAEDLGGEAPDLGRLVMIGGGRRQKLDRIYGEREREREREGERMRLKGSGRQIWAERYRICGVWRWLGVAGVRNWTEYVEREREREREEAHGLGRRIYDVWQWLGAADLGGDTPGLQLPAVVGGGRRLKLDREREGMAGELKLFFMLLV